MTWVKICGNTNLEDAKLAVELGADALGFVFAESRRHVIPAQVAAITSHLPQRVERVAVVQSHDAGEIVDIVDEAGLNTVQLHGGLDLELLEKLRHRLDSGTQIIQALQWTVGSESDLDFAADLRHVVASGIVNRLLVDSRVGAVTGGTGVAFDWKAVHAVLDGAGDHLKVIVAGGLRPDNVADAIRELHPWGVDVVSGVESSPGYKDPAKLAAFIQAAKQAQ